MSGAPDAPPTYRRLAWFFRKLVGVFFSRVEVVGLEHVPREGGGLVVSWHPNGMLDPGLIFAHFPRMVIFGARHGLLRVPVLGRILRAIGTVPIYRAQDGETAGVDRAAANRAALDALARQVAGGRFSCLFPEGDSHDAPHLIPLKTGAAWFYYQARELMPRDRPAPVILPVGLHYDRKRLFRSSTLVEFHPPIQLGAEFEPVAGEDLKPKVKALTARIERELTDAVHATENWELHFLMHRARKLVRAERAVRAGAAPSRPDMKEKVLGFARIWTGYYERLATHPDEVGALRRRVEEYDQDLRALGLEDHELDRDPRLFRWGLAAILLLQVVLVFFLLPPVLVAGMVVNAPAAALVWTAAKLGSKRMKDEASIKLLIGVWLFPLAWGVAGWLAWQGSEWLTVQFPAYPHSPPLAAALTVFFGVVGGMVALRYLRLARRTVRAVRVRMTKARRAEAVLRLRRERAELCDAILALSGGLELPGTVTQDGRVVR